MFCKLRGDDSTEEAAKQAEGPVEQFEHWACSRAGDCSDEGAHGNKSWLYSWYPGKVNGNRRVTSEVCMAGGEQRLSMADRNGIAKVIFPVSHFRV